MEKAVQRPPRAEADPPVVDPDYPIDPVPPHARKGLFSLSIVLLGFTFFTPTMIVGAQVGAAFSLAEFLGVMLVGSTVLGLYVAVLGYIGSRTRLTTVMMCRYALGTTGSKFASLLLGLTQVGWYGVGVAALGNLAAQALGWGADGARGLMVFSALLMGLTAYYGYKGLYALSLASVPLMFVLAGWVLMLALREVGGWSGLAAVAPSDSLAATVAISLIVGTFVSGGTQVPNWTRFAQTGRQAFSASLLAFLVGNGLMLFFGAVGAIAFGEPDFVLVLYQIGLIVWGVVLLVGNIWTTNDNAAYAFSVAGAEITDSRTKRPFVVGGVLVGMLLAVTGIYDNLITYLVWLGIAIPPLGGMLIGDWLRSGRHGLPARETHTFARVRWTNLAAYAVGALAAWASGELGLGIPPLNGILVALAAAWLFPTLTPERTSIPQGGSRG